MPRKTTALAAAVDAALEANWDRTNNEIAEEVGCHRATVRARRKALTEPDRYLSPSDQSRDSIPTEFQRLLEQETWTINVGGDATISWSPDEGLTSSPPMVARAIMALVRVHRDGDTDPIQRDSYTALEFVIRWLAAKQLSADLV